jgi:hypothetical protein
MPSGHDVDKLDRIELLEVEIEVITLLLKKDLLDREEAEQMLEALKTQLSEKKAIEEQTTRHIKRLRDLHKTFIEKTFQQLLRIVRFGYSLVAKFFTFTAEVIAAALYIRCAITGAKALWDLYFAAQDKWMTQRKTRAGCAVMNIVATGLIVGLMATPLGFAILTTITMATGLWKEGYNTYRARAEGTEEKLAIEKDEKNLKSLRLQMINAVNKLPKSIFDNTAWMEYSEVSKEINILKIQEEEGLLKRIKLRKTKLKALRAKRLELGAKAAYYAAGLLGTTIILAGLVLSVLFPPLVPLGLIMGKIGAFLLVTNAFVYTADRYIPSPKSGKNGLAYRCYKIWRGKKAKDISISNPANELIPGSNRVIGARAGFNVSQPEDSTGIDVNDNSTVVPPLDLGVGGLSKEYDYLHSGDNNSSREDSPRPCF